MKQAILLALIAVSLSSCGNEKANGDAVETSSTNATDTLNDNNITAVDFDSLKLGAKIIGPRGPEVKVDFTIGDRLIGKATSYVACPEAIDECNPKELPANTVYTFVHQISIGSGDNAADDTAINADAFSMDQPSYGYNGVSGYSFTQAQSALGDVSNINISCSVAALKWSIDGKWNEGDILTFFWQSTLPPIGPANNYSISTDLGDSVGAGPYPNPELKDTETC